MIRLRQRGSAAAPGDYPENFEVPGKVERTFPYECYDGDVLYSGFLIFVFLSSNTFFFLEKRGWNVKGSAVRGHSRHNLTGPRLQQFALYPHPKAAPGRPRRKAQPARCRVCARTLPAPLQRGLDPGCKGECIAGFASHQQGHRYPAH